MTLQVYANIISSWEIEAGKFSVVPALASKEMHLWAEKKGN